MQPNAGRAVLQPGIIGMSYTSGRAKFSFLTKQAQSEVGTARRAVRGRLGEATLPKADLRPLGSSGSVFSLHLAAWAVKSRRTMNRAMNPNLTGLTPGPQRFTRADGPNLGFWLRH